MSALGVEGPADDSESGDPGVSVTISMGSTGDGAGVVNNEESIAEVWSISVDDMSCRSIGDDGSSLGVEEAVEPDGDEERFDELERFKWLYLEWCRDQHRQYSNSEMDSHLFFAASAVRPGKYDLTMVVQHVPMFSTASSNLVS